MLKIEDPTSMRAIVAKLGQQVHLEMTHLRLINHLSPMHSFSTPWKHQKALRFSDFFRGIERVHWEQMSLVKNSWRHQVKISWLWKKCNNYSFSKDYGHKISTLGSVWVNTKLCDFGKMLQFLFTTRKHYSFQFLTIK